MYYIIKKRLQKNSLFAVSLKIIFAYYGFASCFKKSIVKILILFYCAIIFHGIVTTIQ